MTSAHDRVREQLRAALAQRRLAHAYLLVGPAGVGKLRFARDLAKALLCDDPPEPLAACGRCAACHLVDAGTHPDLIVAEKPADRLEFVIDLMRQLLAQLALKPARGARKIAIVNDADDFNAEAANCFLKTLEEPPPGSLLLLIGTAAERQLPTIRSRCQVLAFRSLDNAAVDDRLIEAGVDDPARRRKLVRLAAGSPGLAVALSDPELWSARRLLLDTVVAERPDGPGLAHAWMTAIEAAGKESNRQRDRAGQLLRLAIDVYRVALDVALGAPPPADDPAEGPLLARLADRLGVSGILDAIDRLLEAEMHIDRKVQLVLIVEALADALTIDAPPRLRPAGW